MTSLAALMSITTFLPGDIAACFGSDLTSRFISGVTSSPVAPRHLRWGPSHVAILCEWRGDLVWVESTTLCSHPCLIRQTSVSGPQVHLPEDRIQDYRHGGGRVDIYRATPLNQFSINESQLLTKLLIQQFVAGKLPYDFSGAILSGTRWLAHSRWFPQADLHSLFCSELVAAILMRLSRLNRANPARFHPARLLRTLVLEGTYEFQPGLSG